MDTLKLIISMKTRIVCFVISLIATIVIAFFWYQNYSFNLSFQFIELAIMDIIYAEKLLDLEAKLLTYLKILSPVTLFFFVTLFIRKKKIQKGE